jgi:hypothetical protein
MIFDQLSIWISVATLILGLLTVIIVGSQTLDDARPIVFWTVVVLSLMLVASCARIAVAGHLDGVSGGIGMVVLCSGLIAAVMLGYRIVTLRHRASELILNSKQTKPPVWDDELA